MPKETTATKDQRVSQPKEERKLLKAHVAASIFRKVKANAALRGISVSELVASLANTLPEVSAAAQQPAAHS